MRLSGGEVCFSPISISLFETYCILGIKMRIVVHNSLEYPVITTCGADEMTSDSVEEFQKDPSSLLVDGPHTRVKIKRRFNLWDV
jgi:hypothetical protein